jgi:thiol-disulfide isomerase/thioredoxin
MTKKILISLAVVTALALGVLYGKGLLSVHLGFQPPAALSTLVLERKPVPAPLGSFVDRAGGRHALGEFHGRYVLFNLWATWCGPCVNELPSLARLAKFAPGLKVIAVDWHEKPAAVDAFLKSHNAGSLPTLVDDSGAIMRGLGAYGLPVTVLIDPDGKIIARAMGPADWGSQDSIAYFKRITAS